jgi:tRNA(fMet)-specific endonuclease VapC
MGLEIHGKKIGPNDLKIAAICMSNGLTLVSGNISEFGRIAGLAVEDWTRA